MIPLRLIPSCSSRCSERRGGAGGAVAFAGEKFRAEPAIVAGDVQADEVADGADVFMDAIKLLGFFPGHRPAIARADRIDENQVGGGQPGVGVVFQMVGGAGGSPCSSRAMRWGRRFPGEARRPRAGTAVEDESDGSVLAARTGSIGSFRRHRHGSFHTRRRTSPPWAWRRHPSPENTRPSPDNAAAGHQWKSGPR